MKSSPLIYLCIIQLMLSTITPAFSQGDVENSELSEQQVTIAEQVIEVNDVIDDKDIQKRLNNILNASEWIDQLSVEVEQGIVVLNGKTQQEEYKTWAESVANKTAGVVAVVNKIETEIVIQDWNLEPAAREATTLLKSIIRALPLVLTGLIVLIITWLLAKLVARLASKLLSKRIKHPFILRLTAKLLAAPVVIIGIYLLLRLTGLTQLAVTVIGGTGLAGLIIGIAFRDIAENFLASILISVQRPFSIGDIIQVDDRKGVVQSVTTRGTVIMTLDGNHIHIPNSIIYKSVIVNLTANPNSRLDFIVGIGYDDSIANAQNLVYDLLKSHEAVLDNPESSVLVENLGASTVNLRVHFWINNREHSTSKVRSSVIRLTKRVFDEAGVSMPDEAREVVFPEGIHVLTEPFEKDSVDHQQQNTTQRSTKKAKDIEPLDSSSESDLSSEVEDIKQQSKDNPLPDDSSNLIDEESDPS